MDIAATVLEHAAVHQQCHGSWHVTVWRCMLCMLDGQRLVGLHGSPASFMHGGKMRSGITVWCRAPACKMLGVGALPEYVPDSCPHCHVVSSTVCTRSAPNGCACSKDPWPNRLFRGQGVAASPFDRWPAVSFRVLVWSHTIFLTSYSSALSPDRVTVHH